MTEQWRPGWYEDGTGKRRWWSGRGWTDHVEDAEAVAFSREGRRRPQRRSNAPLPTVEISSRVRRGIVKTRGPKRSIPAAARVALLVIPATAVAFLLGVGAGASSGNEASGEATASISIAAMRAQLSAVTIERDDLRSAAASAHDVAAEQQQLADDRTALDSRKTDLDTREERLDRRERKIAKREAKAKRAAVTAASTAESEPVASVYYQNCDAARAAGAAPVRRGDPGYGAHLDRDGDGVGCE